MPRRNEVIFEAKVVRPPRYREFESGNKVCNLVLNYVAGGKSNWVGVDAWNELAAWCKDFAEGDMLLVQGKLRQDSYKKKDGTWVNTVKILADRVDRAADEVPEPKGEFPDVESPHTQNFEDTPL